MSIFDGIVRLVSNAFRGLPVIHSRQMAPWGVMIVLSGLVGGQDQPSSLAQSGLAGGAATAPSMWTATGSLLSARSFHQSVVLTNGQVLVIGGNGSGVVSRADCELYNPITGTWSATGSLATGRIYHTATLLSSGQVLVVGGIHSAYNGALFIDTQLASCELYDPASGTWSSTGSLVVGRSFHTASRLASGKILVVSGSNGGSANLVSSEIYDPATGQWSPSGSLNTGRIYHSSSLLPSGDVLVVGGGNTLGTALNSAEIFHVADNSWSVTAPMSLGRKQHSAVVLASGGVLISSGESGSLSAGSCEIFNPVTAIWTTTGSLSRKYYGHGAVLLPSGMVMVIGGWLNGQGSSSCELFDPATGLWTLTASLATGRTLFSVNLLSSGQVLAVGGLASAGTIGASCERYQAGKITPSITWASPASMTYSDALTANQLSASSTVPGTWTYSPAAGTVLGAGTHTLSVQFIPNDSSAYTSATAETQITVVPAILTVTADDAMRRYGAENPIFTSHISGFAHGDTTAIITGLAALSTTATVGSPVSVYSITVATGTLAAANYTFTYQPGWVTITPAPLVVSAVNVTIPVGSPIPGFTTTLSGLIPGDSAAVVAGAPLVSTTATSTSPVGVYPLTVDVSAMHADNYTIMGTDGTLTITSASTPISGGGGGGGGACGLGGGLAALLAALFITVRLLSGDHSEKRSLTPRK